ncbi:Uncharacterized protein TCM_006240 [Theobroma cacao]|uniref:Uncharacterized protein n=1 Tax=Theobroma cacao TaxID=3641 RepID=A0A061DYJ4_THECC|nr:Uncharacterized protein TCM_006240 [Theobroma cacao]
MQTDAVNHHCLTTIMEITAAAESDIGDYTANSSHHYSLGLLARISPFRETRVIGTLGSLLSNKHMLCKSLPVQGISFRVNN